MQYTQSINKTLKNTAIDSEIINLIRKYMRNLRNDLKKYDYAILTTRRCFCLYHSIFKDMPIEEQQLPEYKKVYSSQKVDIIGNRFERKKVLLLDDIMIHGTAVYSIYSKILNRYKAASVDTLVFVKNIEYPDYYEFKTNNYKCLVKETPTDWRKKSNTFVKYIHSTNQLYISYIYGYKTDKEIINKVLSNSECIKNPGIDLKDVVSYNVFEDDDIPQYYICEGYENSYNFIRKASLRIYNDNENFKQVLPYVELKNFDKENLLEIWPKIWTNDEVPENLLKIKNPEDKYKSLITIISLFMYRDFFYPGVKLCNLDIEPTSFINKSYTEDFISDIIKNVKEDTINIINNNYNEVPKKAFNENDKVIEAVKILKEKIHNDATDTEIINAIDMCIWNISDLEEKNFKITIKNNSNIHGSINNNVEIDCTKYINANQLYDCFAQYNKDITDKMYTLMLYFLDCGIIAHVVRCVGNTVGTVVKTGEQSYHIFSDVLKEAFKPVYQLLEFITELNEIDRTVFKNSFIQNLNTLDSKVLNEYKENIIYFINNIPANLRANYFGIAELQDKKMNEESKEKEKAIMCEIGKMVNSIYC